MLCHNCGERPATIHTVIIAGGVAQELYLCSECAKKRGMPFDKMPFVIKLITASPAQKGVAKTCPKCGSSLESLKEKGLLGCSECYEALSEELLPIIKRAQGARCEHVGRRPKHLAVPETQTLEAQGAVSERQQGIEELQKELMQAVERQEYERAAVLRDEIKARKEGGGESHEGE